MDDVLKLKSEFVGIVVQRGLLPFWKAQKLSKEQLTVLIVEDNIKKKAV